MKRRHLILIVITALLLPQVAGALPRPSGGTQSEPEQTIATLSVSANLTSQDTPILQNGRQYKVQVTGTWKPSSAASHIADAAFEATNGSNWAKTGKGLIVGGTEFGRTGGPPFTVNTSGNHFYELSITGRGIAEAVRISDTSGNTDGNSGSLTVVIKSQNTVKWNYPVVVPVSLIVPERPAITATVDTRPYAVTQTMTNIEIVPTMTVTVPIRIEFVFVGQEEDSSCPEKSARMRTYLNGSRINDTKIQCVGNAVAQMFNGGGSTPESFPVGQISYPCGSEPECDFGVGGIFFEFPVTFLPPVAPGPPMEIIASGSSIEILMGWSADTTHLWRTPANDGSGSYEVIGPFNALSQTERTWYTQNMNNLELRIGYTVWGPNRSYIAGTGYDPQRIPGLGQFMEALFSSKVEGQ